MAIERITLLLAPILVAACTSDETTFDPDISPLDASVEPEPDATAEKSPSNPKGDAPRIDAGDRPNADHDGAAHDGSTNDVPWVPDTSMTTDAGDGGTTRVPLNMGAATVDHGVLVSDAGGLPKVTINKSGQHTAVTMWINSNNPFSQPSPAVLVPLYDGACVAGTTTTPSKWFWIENKSASALAAYVASYVTFSMDGGVATNKFTRALAFDADQPANAHNSNCIAPLSMEALQSFGDTYGVLPTNYNSGGHNYRYERTVSIAKLKHPSPTMAQSQFGSGFWSVDWQSNKILWVKAVPNSNYWLPSTETIEGTGSVNLPLKIGPSKSVLVLVQFENQFPLAAAADIEVAP